MKLTKLLKPIFLLTALVILTPQPSQAASATWKAHPISSDWNTAANWQPATVPNGPNDTATFKTLGGTVTFSADTEVNGIVVAAGALPYTITATNLDKLTISGTGITNNSG